MTLKNLFLTDVLENLKRRSWVFWGSFLLFFCSYPGFLLLNLNRIKNDAYKDEITVFEQMKNVVDALFTENPVLVIFIVLLGILLGIQGYAYLHDKKQVNFYHSQPVKRDRRFFVIWWNGVGIYLVTSVVNLVLGILVAVAYGCFYPGLIPMITKAFFFYLIVFLSIYHLSMIAVMLTGNTLVTLLAIGVLLFYELFLRGILLLYEDQFFLTSRLVNDEILKSISSPLMKLWGYFEYFYVNYNPYPWVKDLFPYSKVVFQIGIQAFVFGIVAWTLYKKRPSEAYGRSISFFVIKEPVRVALLILSGLSSTLLFYNMAGNSLVFGIFGAVFAIFLGHVIIQLIYEVDLRTVKKNLSGVFLSLVVTLIFCGSFYFDPLGLDGKLPKISKVESVGISLPGVVSSQNHWIMEDGQEIWAAHYTDNMMHLTDLKTVYEVLDHAMDVKEFKKSLKQGATEEKYQSIEVSFYKKNGKKVVKNLYFKEKEIGEIFHPVYQMDEYRLAADQTAIPGFLETYRIQGADYFNGLNSFSLEKEFVESLHEAYHKDIKEAEYQEIYYQIPVGKITFKGIGIQNPAYTNRWEVLVFPGFERTIALLKSREIDWKAEFDQEFLENTEVLTVSHTDYEKWGRVAYTDKENYTKTVRYEKKEEIEKLLKNALPRDNVYWIQGETPYNSGGSDLEISITRSIEAGQGKETFGEKYEGSGRIVTEILYREGELPKAFERDLGNTDYGAETIK